MNEQDIYKLIEQYLGTAVALKVGVSKNELIRSPDLDIFFNQLDKYIFGLMLMLRHALGEDPCQVCDLMDFFPEADIKKLLLQFTNSQMETKISIRAGKTKKDSIAGDEFVKRMDRTINTFTRLLRYAQGKQPCTMEDLVSK